MNFAELKVALPMALCEQAETANARKMLSSPEAVLMYVSCRIALRSGFLVNGGGCNLQPLLLMPMQACLVCPQHMLVVLVIVCYLTFLILRLCLACSASLYVLPCASQFLSAAPIRG